ncbi:extensin family protein [Candidatus Puniceispirillum sp.]|nr:extensin family protein [Candidatus Puniceispirillum sp.]
MKRIGSYNCRRQQNNGLMSEHSYGIAIDVAVIDGAILTRDWAKTSDHGKTLNNAYKNACKLFSNIILRMTTPFVTIIPS